VNCNQQLCIEFLSVIKFHRETEPTLIHYNTQCVNVTHILFFYLLPKQVQLVYTNADAVVRIHN
jgi:hypothetical protein